MVITKTFHQNVQVRIKVRSIGATDTEDIVLVIRASFRSIQKLSSSRQERTILENKGNKG